ncbi:MAG: (Fe-S)-binding protein [Bacteroidales bacterium]|nr:(Fe-S)-binding protein [Bacteroidales bacterium]
MVKQIAFSLALLITLGVFTFTVLRLISYFRFTKTGFPIRDLPKRFMVMLDVAIGQTKIFRHPVIGFFHALVFWGFCVIIFGSIEMVIDGLSGLERSLKVLGGFYNVIMASGDVFALVVAGSIVIFMIRRLFLHISRFEGIEMKKKSHQDANIALSMILLLMLSLMGMNAAYVELQTAGNEPVYGVYPVGNLLAPIFSGLSLSGMHVAHEFFWWSHILLIFIFANILPYSKHFHVFLSVPNTFLTRLEPLGKLTNMDDITREVKLMLDPNAAFEAPAADAPVSRFGVKDVEDVTWKNYFDSLTCTECGRCSAVCPANTTGKMLSPRKIFMDLRARMKEKGPGLVRKGMEYTDNKSLLRDYISEEELWACTTCNACAQECPVNINHPTLIVDMRRYLVMEESSAPSGLKTMFANIENNGAPWQYSPEDRLLWAENLEMKVS